MTKVNLHVAETACQVYQTTLSTSNFQSSLMRTVIFPLDPSVTLVESTMPAEVFCDSSAQDSLSTQVEMHEQVVNRLCPTREDDPLEQTAYMYVAEAVNDQGQMVSNFKKDYKS